MKTRFAMVCIIFSADFCSLQSKQKKTLTDSWAASATVGQFRHAETEPPTSRTLASEHGPFSRDISSLEAISQSFSGLRSENVSFQYVSISYQYDYILTVL